MLEIPEYTIVLYDLGNQPVLDISKFVSLNMSFVLNDVHTISFDIDLKQFELLCASINATPRNLIYPQRTEVKVFRNGIGLFGGIISSANTSLDENGGKLSVAADSYLQYFATRLLSKNYTATDRSDIAWDAIDTVQSVTNGDLGVTQGSLATVFDSDSTNDYQDVKSIIQLYTYALPTTYDFEITYDKVFNTYLRLGSDKPETELVYPQNITSMTIPRTADSLANKVIGFGSGIGEQRIETTQEDATSQITYRVKEKKVTFNSVIDQTTLEENTEGILQQSTQVLVIPDVVVNGRDFDIGSTKVGDSVKLRVDGSTYNDDIDALVRIFKQDVTVDENVSEDIKLSFYNPNSGGEIEG